MLLKVERQNRMRRKSWALRAMITVLSDISKAPGAGESKMPAQASAPAASWRRDLRIATSLVFSRPSAKIATLVLAERYGHAIFTPYRAWA